MADLKMQNYGVTLLWMDMTSDTFTIISYTSILFSNTVFIPRTKFGLKKLLRIVTNLDKY